jgi:hypothetical protein
MIYWPVALAKLQSERSVALLRQQKAEFDSLPVAINRLSMTLRTHDQVAVNR